MGVVFVAHAWLVRASELVPAGGGSVSLRSKQAAWNSLTLRPEGSAPDQTGSSWDVGLDWLC